MASFSMTAEACSWTNCELVVLAGPLGLPIPMRFPTIQSWGYDLKVNDKLVYGAGDSPIDYTDGQVEPGLVKIKIGISDWNNFLNQVGGWDAARSKANAFTLTINYGLASFQNYSDSFRGCRVNSYTPSAATGPDEVMVELEIRCLQIYPGGLAFGL